MKLFTNAFLWILWNFPEQLFSKILRDVCFWISSLGWLSEAPFPNSNETVPFFLWNIEILKEFFLGCLFRGIPLREKCPYSELFWSVFFYIRTEYGEIRSISPYSVQMWENLDQNNSE